MPKLPFAAAALALALTLAAGPALAAPPDTSQPSNNAATAGTATVSNSGGTPSQRNPVLADNGEVRASKLIGTNIYNQQNQKVGSIDDVLMSASGQPDVIVSTNNKLVQVPWNKLEFGDAKLNSNNKVIMQDENQQALNQQPAFKYTKNQ